MASSSIKLLFVLFLSFPFLHEALAEIVCEDLPKDVCAFSISSAGKRCLLETFSARDGNLEYQCKTSEAIVAKMADYIETDQCVRACGVDRNSVGISSDALLEPQFTAKLCSPDCYQKCPNIVDLYFNLAAGEGAFLPDICEEHRKNPHRALRRQLSSSGDMSVGISLMGISADLAPAPAHSIKAAIPATAPAPL